MAAWDDSREVYSSADLCGKAEFVDYGEGAPGGGMNDDYIVVSDGCPDFHGAKAWAWLDGVLLGSRYNGNGYESSVVWDPFPGGNVAEGEEIGLKVCLVDGNSDPYPDPCMEYSWPSRDG